MASTFKKQLIIGDRSLAESLALWNLLFLFGLSIVLTLWASIMANPDASDSVDPIPSITPTQSAAVAQTPGGAFPVNGPGLDSREQVSASEALKPFFGDGQPNIALLVSSTNALTEREVAWRTDIGFELGLVDAVSYSEANFDRLSEYRTIFVIDFSPELDPSGLEQLAGRGITLHLVGAAAQYAESFELEAGPR